MGKKENIAPCQGYVGWADVESVEYKYPPRNVVKYVLRITLVGSSPRVWREIAVPSTIKLTSLAHVIVLAMGWEESHLSMFKKWRKEYHVYMDGADMYDYPIEDASDYALCDLLAAGEEMTFIYDFGDTWRLEKPREFDPRGQATMTPAGKNTLTPYGKIKMTPENDCFSGAFL